MSCLKGAYSQIRQTRNKSSSFPSLRAGHNESRRSRRLVISFVSTVVNYEYCFYYYFYLDGTISFEIKLTGELSTVSVIDLCVCMVCLLPVSRISVLKIIADRTILLVVVQSATSIYNVTW